MEYNLGNLRIFPYKDIQELDKFYCGIAEMDKFIHNSNGFIMSIDNHYCKAFVVFSYITYFNKYVHFNPVL